MQPSNQIIINKLNSLFETGTKEEYDKYVETLKGAGYKIFRNPQGKHKTEYNEHYFQEMFGGAFERCI